MFFSYFFLSFENFFKLTLFFLLRYLSNTQTFSDTFRCCLMSRICLCHNSSNFLSINRLAFFSVNQKTKCQIFFSYYSLFFVHRIHRKFGSTFQPFRKFRAFEKLGNLHVLYMYSELYFLFIYLMNHKKIIRDTILLNNIHNYSLRRVTHTCFACIV